MSFDGLKTRVFTAVIGICAILALMMYGGMWGMTLLALVACFGALLEYFIALFTFPEKRAQKFLGILVGFLLAALIIFRSSFLYEGISLLFLVLFVFYLFLGHFQNVILKPEVLKDLFSELSLTLSGVFYIGFLFSFWPKVKELELGTYWIFLVFLISWLSDSGGYFIGKHFGKIKLSPVVSPHKTVEGAVGGMVLSTIGVIMYKFFIFSHLSWLDCLAIGILGAILSQVGDLFESFIKRALQVKDSGVVIPGHGGILDRFDSVLFCGPFIYFYAKVFFE